MNKKITLLLAAFTMVGSAFSQVAFDKHAFENYTTSKEIAYDAKTYLTNNAMDAADTNFTWYVVEKLVPGEWETSLCAGDLCVSDPEGDYSISIGVGEKMLFKYSFIPYSVEGSGGVTVYIKSQMDPSYKDSFTVDITASTLSVKESKPEPFSVYPNPAKDYIVVSSTNSKAITIDVYDILGNKHISKLVHPGDKIDISALSTGIYMLRSSGDETFTKVIQKK